MGLSSSKPQPEPYEVTQLIFVTSGGFSTSRTMYGICQSKGYYYIPYQLKKRIEYNGINQIENTIRSIYNEANKEPAKCIPYLLNSSLIMIIIAIIGFIIGFFCTIIGGALQHTPTLTTGIIGFITCITLLITTFIFFRIYKQKQQEWSHDCISILRKKLPNLNLHFKNNLIIDMSEFSVDIVRLTFRISYNISKGQQVPYFANPHNITQLPLQQQIYVGPNGQQYTIVPVSIQPINNNINNVNMNPNALSIEQEPVNIPLLTNNDSGMPNNPNAPPGDEGEGEGEGGNGNGYDNPGGTTQANTQYQ